MPAIGDMAALNELFADDIVWHAAGRNQVAGTFRGKDEVFGTFQKVFELTGGEGLFLATLRGPGRIWLQTMPMMNLAKAIAEYLPKPTSSGSSGGINLGNLLSFVACGSVASDDKAALSLRLVSIHDGLRRVVAAHAPDEAAVEATFVNRDAAATLKLGQARGIAMLVPALAGLPVAEYAPNLVKKTIVGAGHCEKVQIRMMVKVLLPKADPQTDDAADALAIAVTHAHHRQSVALRMAAK